MTTRKNSRDYLEYLNAALASFDNDPPDTAYQAGYRAALKEMKEYLYAKSE